MEVVFILGAHNSGKSTLVRSLTGLGRGNNQHVSGQNIALLKWVSRQKSVNSFCLISSLNEGVFYSKSRFSSKKTSSIRYENTISPEDLGRILDVYENSAQAHCEAAILCISTSKTEIGWTAKDYIENILNGGLGPHSVSHFIVVGDTENKGNTWDPAKDGANIVAPVLDLRRRRPIRNEVAKDARNAIGLV